MIVVVSSDSSVNLVCIGAWWSDIVNCKACER